jgi:hypothetical protein
MSRANRFVNMGLLANYPLGWKLRSNQTRLANGAEGVGNPLAEDCGGAQAPKRDWLDWEEILLFSLSSS